MLKRLLFFIVIAFGAYITFNTRSIDHGPGVLVDSTPVQREIGTSKPFIHKGYRVTPLADFVIEARVLGVEGYTLGREAELSPLDLALGWGPMSDSAVLDQIKIEQSGRFYRWWTSEMPIPRQAIVSNSANMHMVPGDEMVEEQLESLREGDLVRLEGYLIQAETSDGWRWKSSMTRSDSGNGACELVWVRKLTLRTPAL